MSEAIIVAIITGLASVICQIIINNKTRKENTTRSAVKDALLEERLNRLEEKIDIHNGYASKFGEIETDIAIIKNEIKHITGN